MATSLLHLLLLMAFSSWQTFLSVSAKAEFSPICSKGMHINETQFNCAKSYSDIYNALASVAPPFDNNFNIESALFPATQRPSLHVKIWVYTYRYLNGTITKVELAKYTWALSCLYVVLPVRVVELLSFGLIWVNQRQTELHVIVPPFCCNVTLEKRKEHVWHALAALQDLAIRNNSRDPQLNTAECVLLGHDKYDIAAIPAPRRHYLVTMLVCSFLVSIFGGAVFSDILRALIIDKYLGTNGREPKNSTKNRLWTFVCLVATFDILFVVVVAYIVISLATTESSGSIVTGFLVGLIFLFIVILILIILGCCDKCIRKSKNPKYDGFCKCLHITIFPTGVFSLHHVCWIVLGIMLEPAWGVFLLFLLSFMTGALVCLIHSIIDCVNNRHKRENRYNPWPIFVTFCTFITVFSFCLVLLCGGSSNFEKSDVSDWGKSALIYITGGIFTFFYLKFKDYTPLLEPLTAATPSSETEEWSKDVTAQTRLVMRQTP